MTDPIRAALKRLMIMASKELDILDIWVHTREQWDDAIAAARAALAALPPDGPAVPEGREPAAVVGEPSDEELDAMERQCYFATEVCNDSGCEYVFEHRRFARAVLARWGRPAPAPAEGEVADGPAVPEGRESAAVAGEPSDEELANYLLSAGVDAVEGLLYGNVVAWEGRNEQVMAAMRTAIAADRARWGRPAPAPAEGEVAEVIADLRECADSCILSSKRYWAEPMRRAADLLEQRHPAPAFAEGEVGELVAALSSRDRWMQLTDAQVDRAADLLEQRQATPAPVPVGERLPRPEDCEGHGWCWVLYRGYSTWALEPPYGQDGMPTGWSHWLPAHALPLPSGEVEA